MPQEISKVEVFIPQNNQTNFKLSSAPNPQPTPSVEVNGQGQLFNIDYTIDGNDLNWLSKNFSLKSTDRLTVTYFY